MAQTPEPFSLDETRRYARHLVLRGIGFALTELGRLQEAREAYEASLRIEPDNALAKNELAYLDRLQANAAGGK